MSPQLTIQQLEHVIEVYDKRVGAKKLELESYAEFRDTGQAVLADLMDLVYNDGVGPPDFVGRLRAALQTFFSAKYTVASIELEELELTVKALRQQRSGIVGAGMIIPPFNSKRQ